MDPLAAKYIGAGIACIGMGGAGAGVCIIFGNYLAAALRNPSAAQGQFGNLIFGFAVTEALGIFPLLNALSSYIPEDERIVTIEDAAELRLQQTHVARMETRPPNVEGAGAIHIRQLVINSLRMRPDRIIVGEVRSDEALDMLQAMNTGHDGSITTVHSNSPRDTLSRIETMTLMAGMDLPVRVIREQMASALDMVVHLQRLRLQQVPEHLTGEERVPTRLPLDRAAKRRRHRRVRQARGPLHGRQMSLRLRHLGRE